MTIPAPESVEPVDNDTPTEQEVQQKQIREREKRVQAAAKKAADQPADDEHETVTASSGIEKTVYTPEEAQIGVRNSEVVRVIQDVLKKEYGDELTVRVNGQFDNRTRSLVKRYQTDKGLDVTGQVDKETASRLLRGTEAKIEF